MYTHSRMLHIKISPDLLEKVDIAANDTFQSRSSFIRESLALRLNGQYVTKAQQEKDDFDEMLLEMLPKGHPARNKPAN
jgi:predicted transcriptional regulator